MQDPTSSTPSGLKLSGDVHVAPTADELYDDLAMALLGAAIESVAARGVFHVALSGGSSPEPFYMRLVTDPRFRAIPWQQTHAWIVDERRVPEDDPKSNYRMIREVLVDHVPMRRRQAHPMPVLSQRAAEEYQASLAEAMPGGSYGAPPRLDFVLLGMGDDAHTASLFPHSSAIGESVRWVIENDGPAVTPPPRVTMTYPLLNAARRVAVLVTGQKKAEALRKVDAQLRGGKPDPVALPITGIDPVDGTLTWYLDAAAATG